ncbi:MAG: S24 family peptidase [Erysipelotrichaceae bacterium]|nr:S24 family peptidase [Erysipelotrichaceae bacterium]
MDIKDIIKKRRKELKLTLIDIAKACDVSEATVSRWESGDIGDMKRSRIASLARVLQISPSIIVGNEEDEEIYKSAGIDYIRIPLYANLCCGDGGFVEDNIIEYIPVPSKGLSMSSEYFAQIADGYSMKDAGITNGDLLVFEKTNRVDNGVIGCFCVDENIATCKKYTERNNMIMLMPMNSDYDVIIIDPMNSSFRCLGKLKKIIKDIE